MGTRTRFAQEIKIIAIMNTIKTSPTCVERTDSGTRSFPSVFITELPANKAPKRAKIAINVMASLLDLAPAPYAVAIEAAELFAPIFTARRTDKPIAIGSTNSNYISP